MIDVIQQHIDDPYLIADGNPEVTGRGPTMEIGEFLHTIVRGEIIHRGKRQEDRGAINGLFVVLVFVHSLCDSCQIWATSSGTLQWHT